MTDSKRVAILTVSDTRSQGLKVDTATPVLRSHLEEAGFTVEETILVPDEYEQIKAWLIDMADRQQLPLVITTGGTGFGPRDVTPEATQAIADRMIPGIPEMLRSQTAKANPRAWLSRAGACLRGNTLIINLPGKPDGVKECLEALLPLLPHALEMIQGKSHEESHIIQPNR